MQSSGLGLGGLQRWAKASCSALGSIRLCRGDVPFDDAEIMRRMRPSVEAARALGIY